MQNLRIAYNRRIEHNAHPRQYGFMHSMYGLIRGNHCLAISDTPIHDSLFTSIISVIVWNPIYLFVNSTPAVKTIAPPSILGTVSVSPRSAQAKATVTTGSTVENMEA